jgi:hypothetical protein
MKVTQPDKDTNGHNVTLWKDTRQKEA